MVVIAETYNHKGHAGYETEDILSEHHHDNHRLKDEDNHK